MKLKKNSKKLKQYNTLSGLNSKTSGVYIIAISIILGISIFAMIPYVSNRLNRPITSSILNVVPNGMILGFFIVEKNFEIYFKGLILAPLLYTAFDIIFF